MSLKTIASVFSGIGGWDLAGRSRGLENLWMCEINPFRTAVLEQRFPGVPIYPDVRGIRTEETPRPDILCASFPCQDVSVAGSKRGIAGPKSGIWVETIRLVRGFRPDYLVMENVASLASFGLDLVLDALAQIGYDAEWECLTAEAFGAPHKRDRIWIVAYPDSNVARCPEKQAFGPRFAQRLLERQERRYWDEVPRPDIRGVDDGVPLRLDRLASLGDSLLPQIAEAVLEAVSEFDLEVRQEPADPRWTPRKPWAFQSS